MILHDLYSIVAGSPFPAEVWIEFRDGERLPANEFYGVLAGARCFYVARNDMDIGSTKVVQDLFDICRDVVCNEFAGGTRVFQQANSPVKIMALEEGHEPQVVHYAGMDGARFLVSARTRREEVL